MTSSGGATSPVVERFTVTVPVTAALNRNAVPLPTIQFRVKAPRYDEVYVRLTVRKGTSGDFYYVPRLSSGAISGNDKFRDIWSFHRVPTGKTIATQWSGKTYKTSGSSTRKYLVSGPNFKAQDGLYEFRLVAVDLAGNVSELRRTAYQLIWAQRPEMKAKEADKSRADSQARGVTSRIAP